MNPFVLFLALLSVTAGCASAATHPVSVRVTARTEAGAVMPEVPLGVSTGASAGYGLTGPDGVLTLTLDADDDTFQAVSARLFGNFRRADVEHLRPTALAQYKALREQYSFDTAYVQPVAATATDVDVTVIAYPAVTVTATIRLGPAPAPDYVLASVAGGMFWEPLDTDVEVTIKGVRQGASGTLYFGTEDGELFSKTLTAAQTQSSIALGEVRLERHATDASLKLTMTSRELVDERIIPSGGSVFLVRSDGQVVYSRSVHTDGRVISGLAGGAPTFAVPIPAGTYYVIPGSPGGAQQNKLVAMITAGNLAALDAAGVPKVQVAAGQTLEATVDATKAYAAIKTAKP